MGVKRLTGLVTLLYDKCVHSIQRHASSAPVELVVDGDALMYFLAFGRDVYAKRGDDLDGSLAFICGGQYLRSKLSRLDVFTEPEGCRELSCHDRL